ncbi:hypothetical protein WJX72_006079 [[Myrmecia] bisecta]|uniref:ShKT domain-containing protein n=1 Tax=[Myrmecia] bisecta TaxID=41462 RepID=A0AAW1PAX1_9CHLO
MSPQTCSAYQCKDTAWLNIECAAGFVCLRQNAWYWQCIADQDAAATAAQWLAFPGNAPHNAPVMPAAPNCVDIQPPGAYTCAMQKTYGKCSAPWMQAGNFCAATCGTCGGGGGAVPAPPQCTDVAPPGPYTCAQQKSFNKCSAQWMAPYCAQTCGRC